MKKLLSILLFLGTFSVATFAQSETSGAHYGHEWVDLGLSVKWATCNVGASTPDAYGNYYAWGDIKTKSNFNLSNCVTLHKSAGSIGGNSSLDAARANWGGNWRMPTKEEFQELIDNCTWTWTSQNGHNGYKVTSKKNSQSIFLPAAGGRYGDKLNVEGMFGYYWSSIPASRVDTEYSCSLYFDEGSQNLGLYYRVYGYCVRPVLISTTANVHEGYGWVNLGLPSGLKWATCNVGAINPEPPGSFFAWGEIYTNSSYMPNNCTAYGRSWGDIGGDSSRDVARARWGGSWRMPTKAEFQELKDNCTWTWTTQSGWNGYKVTGPNGNSIFLPAGGYRGGIKLFYSNECGFYWTSTPDEGNADRAWTVYFGPGGLAVEWKERDFGFCVRPVLED